METEILNALRAGGGRWLEIKKLQPEAAKSFAGAELSEVDFSGRDLAEMDFSQADMFHAKLGKANMKRSVLVGTDFTGAVLHSAGLYKCNLQGAIAQEADLTDADLSECDCRNVDFRGAVLRNVDFSGADLRGADLSQANLTGAVLRNADITGAIFRFAVLDGADMTQVRYSGYKSMSGHYYGVRGIGATFGNALFVRDAKDQDYIDTMLHTIREMPPGWLKSFDLMMFRAWGLIDNGRSLGKVSLYASIIATIYGLIYTLDFRMGWGMMDYSNSAQSWFTPFYYSMVTYTTLGYGDVTAENIVGEFLVISEVVIGYFTLGLLLSILANTIARRS